MYKSRKRTDLSLPVAQATLEFLGSHFFLADRAHHEPQYSQEAQEARQVQDCCYGNRWGSGSASCRSCSFDLSKASARTTVSQQSI